VIGNMLNFEN